MALKIIITLASTSRRRCLSFANVFEQELTNKSWFFCKTILARTIFSQLLKNNWIKWRWQMGLNGFKRLKCLWCSLNQFFDEVSCLKHKYQHRISSSKVICHFSTHLVCRVFSALVSFKGSCAISCFYRILSDFIGFCNLPATSRQLLIPSHFSSFNEPQQIRLIVQQ